MFDIIRAVSSTDLLGWHGYQLRRPKGSPEVYSLSFPTREIDAFVSHSWRHPGILKYLALCYHYNNRSAIAVALSAVACIAALRTAFGPPMVLVAFPSFCPNDPPRLKGLELCSTYMVVYLITLLHGHAFLPSWVLRRQRFFHDKNCICAHIPEKFAAGVRALHEFLHCSKSCVVMYNDDYLERLWCVYELAAYTAHELNDDGSNLIFISPIKAPAVLLMLGTMFLWPLLEYLSLYLAPVEHAASSAMPVPIAPLCMLLLFIGLTGTVLLSGRERADVLRRLDTFTVAAGKCFSEPDRGYIQAKICSWYAQPGELQRKRWLAAAAANSTHTGWIGPTTARHLRHEAQLIARFEREVHRGGRIYGAVERMVGRNRSGLSLLDILTFNLIQLVSVFEYGFDNPWGTNMGARAPEAYGPSGEAHICVARRAQSSPASLRARC